MSQSVLPYSEFPATCPLELEAQSGSGSFLSATPPQGVWSSVKGTGCLFFSVFWSEPGSQPHCYEYAPWLPLAAPRLPYEFAPRSGPIC